jgi:hypothetical protein
VTMADDLKAAAETKPYIWAPIIVALIFTVLFLVVIILLSLSVVDIDGVVKSRWSHFFDLTPNAIGDTLAGIFGSLTLVWIVASVFQQSLELRAQRAEFSEMVKAQNAQVDTLNAQTVLLLAEEKKRNQVEKFTALVQQVSIAIKIVNKLSVSMVWEFQDGVNYVVLTPRLPIHERTGNKETRDIDFDKLSDGLAAINEVARILRELKRPFSIKPIPSVVDILTKLEVILAEMVQFFDEYSPAARIRLNELDVPAARKSIDYLVSKSILWSSPS